MEGTIPVLKYQKLASEYSKLRAQASVLKKAVDAKKTTEIQLKEQIRQRETSLRRTEQEVDSLSFRNKQLESRVAALQQEISHLEITKKGENEHIGRSTFNVDKLANEQQKIVQETLLFEELQKKIMDNAQLSSLIDDKERDLLLYTERISSLEQKLEKRFVEHNEVEKYLRKDIELLQNKISELENKLVEAASMVGSEDALSATGSDTPIYNTQQQQLSTGSISIITTEDRLATLEKEVAYWRAQYEVIKLSRSQNSADSDMVGSTCSCSTTAAGLTYDPENKSDVLVTKEQLIYNQVSKKYEDLLRLKCVAESRLISFEMEVVHLQNCLENATFELKGKDDQVDSLNKALQLIEEDLATTRLNYDDKISVLTEQIISLSEQLAASK